MDVLDRFLSIAEAQKDHAAVHHADVITSYGELARFARKIAFEAQIAPHPKVLIYLGQSAEAYGAMFGALMAGGYYAPVNLEAPHDRQKLVIDQFEPDVVITSRAALDKGGMESEAFGAANIVLVEELGDGELTAPRPAHDLAYVIFTSGSTGVPKGVKVGRAGLGHYTDWAIHAMNVTPEDRWSQFPPISFDLSVLDIYGALCAGATLCPFTSPRDRMMPARAIKDYGLTIWDSVPSVVGMMMQAGQLTTENLSTLRLATFCGEPLLPRHVEGLFAARPDLVVHNTYGPTEATVSFTQIKLEPDDFQDHARASMALGDAIPGMELHLIDGEIVITGPQVARGYWNNPDLSAEVFKTIEADGRSLPAYFTGDLAERDGDDLFFVSRKDFQVKINGYRVELEDINAAVRAATSSEAAAIALDNQIHCFVEKGPSSPLEPEKLVQKLQKSLENYAIPNFFYEVDSLPRNANDKIDIKALEHRVQKNA